MLWPHWTLAAQCSLLASVDVSGLANSWGGGGGVNGVMGSYLSTHCLTLVKLGLP